jgi:putative endonuclease
MTFCVYILFPKKLNGFYIGTSDDFQKRLIQHNSAKDKSSHTYRGIPWEEFLVISHLNSSQAYAIEKKIKSMKSQVYIRNLKKYPEMIEKLKTSFG